jgi:hypothetical protein
MASPKGRLRLLPKRLVLMGHFPHLVPTLRPAQVANDLFYRVFALLHFPAALHGRPYTFIGISTWILTMTKVDLFRLRSS